MTSLLQRSTEGEIRYLEIHMLCRLTANELNQNPLSKNDTALN